MKNLSKRAFLGDQGLNLVQYSSRITTGGVMDMTFSLFIGQDVTLHRSFVIVGNKNFEHDKEDAFAKIERLTDTLSRYISRLEINQDFVDHRGIGTMTDPVTKEYHGESSTVHIQAIGPEVIFSITSCEHKIRTTYDRTETTRLLKCIQKHLETHLRDAEQLLLENE
ncbi:hypothetical protein [Vibrio phage phiKT1028]|nr:hypothetical protein [Vibrio phage phiKT1028]